MIPPQDMIPNTILPLISPLGTLLPAFTQSLVRASLELRKKRLASGMAMVGKVWLEPPRLLLGLAWPRTSEMFSLKVKRRATQLMVTSRQA